PVHAGSLRRRDPTPGSSPVPPTLTTESSATPGSTQNSCLASLGRTVGKEPIQRFNKGPGRPYPVHSTSITGHPTQEKVKHSAKMVIIVVIGNSRAQQAMQSQAIQGELQIVAMLEHGLFHGGLCIGARIRP